MEYSSMRRPPGIVRSHTDDDNHSIFDFPIDPEEGGRRRDDDDDDDDDKMDGRVGKKRHRSKPGKRKKKKAASSEPPPAAASFSHPYPSSISIQMNNNGSPPATKSKHNEFRSPTTSPGERHDHRSSNREETRQPNSPKDPAASPSSNHLDNSELTKHHLSGNHHFQSNRLSEAVDSYSFAIRSGLEDLTHRKEMVARMMGNRAHNAGTRASEQDDLLLELGASLSQVHFDLGKTLEIAQKFGEAKVEYENGLGMLLHTCRTSKNDKRVKQSKRDIGRMDRAMSVKEERRRATMNMETMFKKLHAASNSIEKDDARRSVISSLKKLLRIERDSLGEHSYAYAKLTLKLSKVKCEGGDIEGGLHDANAAVSTIKSVLGTSHTLVGAACLFVAAVYEKRASMMYDKSSNALEGGGMVTAECKSLMNKALELYADALGPLKFKYDHLDESGDRKHSTTTALQPDIGETFHKIAKLYAKKGSSHASAVDAYHRALEAYGATGMNRNDTTKKSSSYQDYHPDAACVWYDLAQLHLTAQEYNDAVYAAEKVVELSRQVLKSSASYNYNDGTMEALAVLAFQIAGDGYGGLHRHEDAGRSYQEAYFEFKKIARNRGSSKGQGVRLGSVEEATILRKLGMSLYHRGKLEDAKTHLMDALRTLRSANEGSAASSASADLLPALLSDYGMVNIKCGEYSEAMKALRSCLKLYADRGVSNHNQEVERARQLFKEAQRTGAAMSPSTSAMSPSKPPPATNSPSKQLMQQQLMMAGTPSTAMSSTGVMSVAMMSTPRSSATSLTVPSTGNYSRSSSTKSGHNQLQTLLEELTDVDHDSKGVISPEHSHLHYNGQTQSVLQKSFTSDIGSPQPRMDQSSMYEMQHSQTQLEESMKTSQQYQLRIKQVEAERDQEKKERVFAAAAHRKEMDSTTQSNLDKALMEAELETLRKEVNISESSYQELVKAIDDEKEKISEAHESKVRELQKDVKELKDQLKYAGAIENNRLSEELVTKKREIGMLNEESQKMSREVASLQATNRSLQSEKDATKLEVSTLKSKNDQLQADTQRLSSELAAATAKVHSARDMPNKANSIELKKLEFELQSERNRRMILEASLQKEYDRDRNTNNGSNNGGNNGGGFAYPMMHPFGYPPMQVGMHQQQANNSDNNNRAKLNTLEIDLATERAGKEMLENVITDLRTTHEQEKESMQSQYSSWVATHEFETSELLAQVGEKRAEVDLLTQDLSSVNSVKEGISRQLHDTTSELTDVKEQLVQMSRELASTMEEKTTLSITVRKLEGMKEDFNKTREDLHKTKAELKIEKQSLGAKETEGDCLREDNERLKKEYLESITIFESEVDRVKADRSTLDNEVERLQSELVTAKHHLQHVLGELEAGRTDIQHLNIALDGARKDARSKEEQLRQVQREIKEVTSNYEELEANLSELEDIITSERQERGEQEGVIDETRSKLSLAERTIEELNENTGSTITSLKEDKRRLEKILSVTEEQKNKLDQVLRAIPQKLEGLLPDLDDSSSTEEEAPDDENNAHHPTTPESLASRISALLEQISDHVQHQKKVVDYKNSALEKTEWNLASTADDLDKLEVKHITLKKELKEMGDLQSDYDELLEQYELEVEEKETLVNSLKSIKLERDVKANESLQKANESLLKAQEERDLFESRLTEAVDDLEELECERDKLKVEVDSAHAEFAKKEGLLGDRVRALETDNKLIETLESQALEYDAALCEKEAALKSKAFEYDAALSEKEAVLSKKDEKIKNLEEELQTAQTQFGEELQTAQSQLAEVKVSLAEMELERMTTVKKTQSIDESGGCIYPDILSLDKTRSDDDLYPDISLLQYDSKDELASQISNGSMFGQVKEKSLLELATNPFADDSSEEEIFARDIELATNPFADDSSEEERDVEPATNPFADDSSDEGGGVVYDNSREKEAAELKARVIMLEGANADLNEQINRMKLEHESRCTGIDDEFALSREKSDIIEMEREREAMIEEVESLKDYVGELETINEAYGNQLAESRDEVAVAATIHDNDSEAIACLQKALEENNDFHQEETDSWKNQVDELQQHNQALRDELSSKQSLALANDESGSADVTASSTSAGEDAALFEEVEALKDQIHTLEDQNVALSEQLGQSSPQIKQCEHDALLGEIESLQKEIQELKDCKEELNARLAQSEAEAGEAACTHDYDMSSLRYSLDENLKKALADQEETHRADLDTWKSRVNEAEQAHENDQATIMSLQNAMNDKDGMLPQALTDQDKLHQAGVDTWKSRVAEAEKAHERTLQNALKEKEELLQDKLKQALNNQDELHQSDLGTWKSKVADLEESNDALARQLSELRVQTDHTECNEQLSSIQMDLQNALNESEEKKIQHNLQLSTVNAEFHNAQMSLDEMQKENQNLKGEIESLSSMAKTIENRNFEKEMNASHARFESMEKALQDRVSRLERDKDKLVTDFNDEMINQEEEHTQTKIELSAWKLEMQNALNDIESLKKERDDLKAQVQSYVTSLEAVCTGKAKLEEKMHSLGISIEGRLSSIRPGQ